MNYYSELKKSIIKLKIFIINILKIITINTVILFNLIFKP